MILIPHNLILSNHQPRKNLHPLHKMEHAVMEGLAQMRPIALTPTVEIATTTEMINFQIAAPVVMAEAVMVMGMVMGKGKGIKIKH